MLQRDEIQSEVICLCGKVRRVHLSCPQEIFSTSAHAPRFSRKRNKMTHGHILYLMLRKIRLCKLYGGILTVKNTANFYTLYN